MIKLFYKGKELDLNGLLELPEDIRQKYLDFEFQTRELLENDYIDMYWETREGY